VGVKARTSKELEEQGLIYIENEGGGDSFWSVPVLDPLLDPSRIM
jgi:hypothetical protein